MSRRALRAVLVVAVSALVSSGCEFRPTYPKARLADALRTILERDGLMTSIRLIDRTLAIQLAYPGALKQQDGQITVGPEFDTIVRKVLIGTHRVLLSSDAQAQFYVLLLSDPQIPGAYLTMVRYVDDVRRAYVNMIDTNEMFARTIFELNLVGPKPVTLEQYIPREIRMEEFLSWQVARRIQHALAEELQNAGIATVGRCGGRFENGEFAFTLDVSPASEERPIDEATLRQVFHTSTNVIAQVLSSYRFDSFDQVRLTHPLTGRNLVLPKTRLDLFR